MYSTVVNTALYEDKRYEYKLYVYVFKSNNNINFVLHTQKSSALMILPHHNTADAYSAAANLIGSISQVSITQRTTPDPISQIPYHDTDTVPLVRSMLTSTVIVQFDQTNASMQ